MSDEQDLIKRIENDEARAVIEKFLSLGNEVDSPVTVATTHSLLFGDVNAIPPLMRNIRLMFFNDTGFRSEFLRDRGIDPDAPMDEIERELKRREEDPQQQS